MVKLDKKKKFDFPNKLAKQVIKVQADLQGIPIKEFIKKRKAILKSQEEYQKTHWVTPLTDAQKFFIATSTTPSSYMNKHLSKSNLIAIEHYKLTSKGYAQHVAAREAAKKLRQGIEKTYEPFKKLQQEYQAIGKRLRSTFEPEQQIAQKLTMGLGSLNNPFNLRPDLRTGIKGGGLLDVEVKKLGMNRLWRDGVKSKTYSIDKGHGLNRLMQKHKMKSPLEVADHFLKVKDDPKRLDYFVENYGNSMAFAEACGVMPVKVFELIAREIKKSKKHYVEQALIQESISIEELVNEFNNRKKKNDKYPMKQFFSSKFRKDWSYRNAFDWTSYQRFHEMFPKWVKIMNARAKKFGTKEDSDIDVMLNMIAESKKGK